MISVYSIQKEVKAFIIDTFLFGESEDELKSDTSFLEQGFIDSTGVLELIDFLENTYSIKVEDEELHPDNLDSLQRIEQYVVCKQSKQVE